MDYKYHNRGKCSLCNQIVWITTTFCSIRCECYKSFLSSNNSQSFNTVEITDEEFISAIKAELNYDEDINLIKI